MEAAAQPSPIAGFVPIFVILAIFYFLVLRPQNKQVAEHKKMLEELKKGDRVVTTGGLHGVIVSLRGVDLQIKIADNVVVTVTRQAIQKKIDTPELASTSV